jgi:hypothetical protein
MLGMSILKNKISLNDVDERQGKARVTMYLDLDVLNSIREEAKSIKLGYQTYINQILREVFVNEEKENKSITKFLLNEIEGLKKEVAKIKKAS